MRFIFEFLERYLAPSLIKYYLIGGIAVVLHFLIVIFIVEQWLLHPSAANAIAFVLATIFSNIANTYWSFETKVSSTIFLRFWSVALLGLCLAVLISSTAEYFGLHYLVGILLVVSVTPIVSYTLHKNWTYK